MAVPVLGTLTILDITESQFSAECETTSGAPLTAHGFVIGESENPTIGDTVFNLGALADDEEFADIIDGLDEGTTYHCRAFATNGDGTAYSSDEELTTLITQNSDPDGLGFFLQNNTLPGQNVKTRQLTIDVTESDDRTTGIACSVGSNGSGIVTAPASVDHNTAFNISVEAPMDAKEYWRPFRRIVNLTFSKAGYKDLIVPITVEAAP